MALFEARELHLRFGDRVVLENVSLAFEAGRLSGIMGPNGAGKTTCFNVLTGRYKRGEEAPGGSRIKAWRMSHLLSDERFDKIDRLTDYATARGASLLDVAIGGLAAKPAVASVIAGATSIEQLQANVKAAEWTPSAEDLAALNEVD